LLCEALTTEMATLISSEVSGSKGCVPISAISVYELLFLVLHDIEETSGAKQ
jgi:hypothetical protein